MMHGAMRHGGSLLATLLLAGCLSPRDLTRPDDVRLLVMGAVEAELALAPAVVGVTYREQLLARGGDGSYRWSLASGSLPQGLVLTPDGMLSGTPLDTGTVRVGITVASGGQTAGVTARLVTAPRLTISTELLPIGIAGQPYRYPLQASIPNGPVIWSIVRGRLPSGLSLSSDGVLSGTPSGTDSVGLTVEAMGGGQIASRLLPLVIHPDSQLSVVSGQVTHFMSEGRRTRRVIITVPATVSDTAIHVAVSPDVASDSLADSGGLTAGVMLTVYPIAGHPQVRDTVGAYRRVALPAVSFRSPYQAPRRTPADSQLFCGFYWVVGACSYGDLVYLDSAYAYYEDRNLASDQRNPLAWYEEVVRRNAEFEPRLRRIWGVPTDVDGNGRINIFVTGQLSTGLFMWNNCVGPGPVDPTSSTFCVRTAIQEMFNAGPMSLITRSQGLRASAGFFAITQTTDAQEYIQWTQAMRFPGLYLSDGTWQSRTYIRHNHYRGGWDATLGNGISQMVRYIVTKAVDTLPDGTDIGGYFQADGWRFSCLSTLRTCRVHRDTYVTPGMFGYWLWQHFGDGIGDRYTRAVFGDYYGDVWEQAVGLRGAHLFNMFFLSTVLDDTPLGRASGLEWPENPVPQKLPGVRSQMHELSVGNSGTYFAPYSGPQIVRISGVRPGTSYVLDLEFLSSTRTAVTIVRP